MVLTTQHKWSHNQTPDLASSQAGIPGKEPNESLGFTNKSLLFAQINVEFALGRQKQTRDGILLLIGYLLVFILVLLPKIKYKQGVALPSKGLEVKLPFPAKMG